MPRPDHAPTRRTNLLREQGMSHMDWKDTAVLRRFTSDRGKIRSRRIPGLTPQQHRQVATATTNAREMALLPYPTTKS